MRYLFAFVALVGMAAVGCAEAQAHGPRGFRGFSNGNVQFFQSGRFRAVNFNGGNGHCNRGGNVNFVQFGRRSFFFSN